MREDSRIKCKYTAKSWSVALVFRGCAGGELLGRRRERERNFLWVVPELDGDGDVGIYGTSAFRGGCVLVLLDGVDGGLVKLRGAAENLDGFDAAFGVDEGIEADVAGDEVAHGVGRIDGRDGFEKLGGY
jgi:hypothetical protein